MSWSDDMRCLYCDGKLPLYRKITHGQFCSTSHRKAYWQEQERLAVERLHQSHTSLKAVRPPAPAEPVRVPPPAERTLAGQTPANEATLGGLVRSPEVLPQPNGAPRIVCADPLAYDMERAEGRPVWSVADGYLRSVPEAGPLSLWKIWFGQAWLERIGAQRAPLLVGNFGPRLKPAVPLLPALRILPALDLPAQHGSQTQHDEPPVEGPVEIPLSARQLIEAFQEPRPMPSRMPRPAANIALSLRPVTAALDPSLELPAVEAAAEEVAEPASAGLVRLAPFSTRAAAAQLVQAVQAVSSRFSALTFPHLPSSWSAALRELASSAAMPKFAAAGSAALPIQAVASAPLARQDFANIRQLLSAQPLRVSLSRPPLLSMGKGSRYRLQVPSAHTPGEPGGAIDFPRQPGNLLLPEPSSAPAPVRELAIPASRGVLPLTVQFGAPAGAQAKPVLAEVGAIPQPLRREPLLPVSRLEPLDEKPASGLWEPFEAGFASEPASVRAARLKNAVVANVANFWQLAPRDLKLLAFVIPALLALAFHRELPKVSLAAPSSSGIRRSIRNAVNTQIASVRQVVLERAAVALDDDFRAGLDDWASRGDGTATWSFDATGFVRPGPLALYRPSMNLTDYQVQFLGMIDKKSLSWVVRAADFDNYYVLKLVVLKPGPITTVGLTRYAVINGKAEGRVDTPVPIEAQPDTIYRVRVDVDGENFSLNIQGQMIDSWSEPRLARGGVGFFTSHGEESRVRWIAVTHQYDMLGRLCAYLAPYETPTTNGSW